jgi:ATP-dependent RNA helicase DDX3X
MSENGAAVEPSANGNAANSKEQKLADNLAKVKAAGWNNAVPMNNETVGSGVVTEDPGLDEAPWLCNAAVYQWDDEFGDVGPEDPRLEEMLFRGEHLMKIGNRVKALEFEVQTFGPDKVAPIRSVCQEILWSY